MSIKELSVGSKLDSDARLDAVYFDEYPQCESKRVLRMGSHNDEITFQCLECGFFNRFEFLSETDDGYPEISRVVERKGFGVARFELMNHDGDAWIFHESLSFDDLLGFVRTSRNRKGFCEFTRWNEEYKRCETVLSGHFQDIPF